MQFSAQDGFTGLSLLDESNNHLVFDAVGLGEGIRWYDVVEA